MSKREEIKELDVIRRDAEQKIKDIISNDVRVLLKKAERDGKLKSVSSDAMVLYFPDCERHVGTDKINYIFWSEGADAVAIVTDNNIWGKYIETYPVEAQIEIYNIIEQRINS